MRRAFSLLELIIAIVVIALSIAALPFVVGGAMRGNSAAIVQEMITATKSVISDATTYPWNDVENSSSGSILIPNDKKDDRIELFKKGTLTSNRGFAVKNLTTEIDGSKCVKGGKNESGVFVEGKIDHCEVANGIEKKYNCSGINCLNEKEDTTNIDGASPDKKRILDLHYEIAVKYAKIDEKYENGELSADFSSGDKENKSALLIEVTSNLKKGTIEGAANGVALKAYSFNIGHGNSK